MDGWDVISTYTRADALDDGVLVDVTEMAQEAGWNFPVAITQHLYAEITPTEAEKQQLGQSYEGRLWDVLSMAAMTARAINYEIPMDRMGFQVIVAHREGDTLLHLLAHIGPGDQREPVITIGYPRDF